MKYFVISDCHGFYSLLMKRLEEEGFDENNPNHCIISLGDMFDRGPEPIEMLKYYQRMVEKKKIILVKGNHEDLFIQVLEHRDFIRRDYHNRTYETYIAFCEYLFPEEGIDAFKNHYLELLERMNNLGVFKLIDSMYNYVEIGKYIFVHGYLPTHNDEFYPNWRKVKDWWEAEWTNGMEYADGLGIYEEGKKVVCGHVRTSYGNVRKIFNKINPKYLTQYTEDEISAYEYGDVLFDDAQKELINVKSIHDIYYGTHVIGIDACTALCGQINIFTFESDEEVKTESKPYEHTYEDLLSRYNNNL